MQIVGVARTTKYGSLVEHDKPFFYMALRQGSAGGSNFQIRTRLGPETMANTLVREIKTIDANLAPGEVITMREQVGRRTWSQGAAGPDVLRIVMLRGFQVTMAGMCVGGAAALGLARLMGDLLYKTSPRDPGSFGAAFVTMAMAAIAACLLPAWRAMRTDPVQTLRRS
jgi:hypothetical protein